ncbi:MAG: polynucleotide adenylyltransferase, partial [Clostridia bacterium]|nr:polynucleotide adenylyltransferase [Clostridia bacterium]
MKSLIFPLPPQVQAAIDRLERGGFEAYAVGGCVRDTLLQRIPNDWDITTSARPEQTAACFRGFRIIETGI